MAEATPTASHGETVGPIEIRCIQCQHYFGECVDGALHLRKAGIIRGKATIFCPRCGRARKWRPADLHGGRVPTED